MGGCLGGLGRANKTPKRRPGPHTRRRPAPATGHGRIGPRSGAPATKHSLMPRLLTLQYEFEMTFRRPGDIFKVPPYSFLLLFLYIN